MLDTLLSVLAGAINVLWWVLVVLYSTFPLYWITWPATAVLAMSAWGVYRERGRGAAGAWAAARYAVVNLPRAIVDVVRWIANQAISLVEWRTGRDVTGALPTRLAQWLGRSAQQARVRTRVVERTVYTRPPDAVVLLRAAWVVLKGLPNALMGLLLFAGAASLFP